MNKSKQEINDRDFMDREDDFFIDESLVRLLSILIPRMKWILLISFLGAAAVGVKLFLFTPRQYVCSAVIAPDVMRDLNSFDLVQLKSVDSDIVQLPFASQLSQLKTLADSSQVKNEIVRENQLMALWECQDSLDCFKKLQDIYSVREVRNVGLELKAQYDDRDITQRIVQSAIDQTNKFFEDSMKAKAERSIQDIHKWINDVTGEIEAISSELIRFASNNNITDLESQFASGNMLIGTIKQSIIMKESELADLMQQYGDDSRELLPIKGTIKDLRSKLTDLLEGTEEDGVYPPLSKYEQLRLKVRDYQDKLQMLRSRAELFNKQLAAAQIESQKQSRTLMILDEPFIEPAAKGTVKFSVLAFIGLFFFGCIFVVMKEYWKTLREAMAQSGAPQSK
ncbi:MAG: hypothetical protein JXR73_02055 [Candidatus Omnitrophica bacterium]|nr:hypothetical protein [Candidatus Omnitrophota bacterium]